MCASERTRLCISTLRKTLRFREHEISFVIMWVCPCSWPVFKHELTNTFLRLFRSANTGRRFTSKCSLDLQKVTIPIAAFLPLPCSCVDFVWKTCVFFMHIFSMHENWLVRTVLFAGISLYFICTGCNHTWDPHLWNAFVFNHSELRGQFAPD